jgi:hypothetical protein
VANDWLNHKELKIIRGVYIAPGDTFSVEPAIVTCNLMSTGQTGITLKTDGWSPNIPSLKDSGVWADSPISDGRQLISGVNANVTESMQLTITGSTFQEAALFLSQLRQMTQDARDFWQSNAQINPVYLKWWASCGAGAQYALIYNMDFKPEYVQAPVPTISVTLTIERECFWRSLPPGANPKQWRYEFYNQVYSIAKSRIGDATGADDLISAVSVSNKSEFNAAFTSLISSNFITIPAALIPGDAPALMTLAIDSMDTTRFNIIIGKKTLKIAIPTYVQNVNFNAADGTLGTNATLVNDAGAVKGAGAANAQRVEVSFATATNQLRWRSNGGTVTSILNRQIGQYQVFLRCRQNGGAIGDITMYLRGGLQILSDSDGVKMNVVYPPAIAGGGASTNWGLVNMGTITLPQQPSKARVSANSSSSSGLNTESNVLDFGLFALRSAGAGVLYVCDLILIPIDEGGMTIEATDASGNPALYYDNTGYYTHGTPDEMYGNGFPINDKLAKLTGSGIQLTPNIENRLYVATYDASNQSQVADTMRCFVDIIPRWCGIRGI